MIFDLGRTKRETGRIVRLLEARYESAGNT
jgi:hypothetical protein